MDMCEANGLSDFSCNAISWGLYFCYFLFFGSVLAIVGLFFVNALKDTKVLVSSAIGAGILAVLFAVSYALSGSEVSSSAIAMGVDEASSKLIGGGLIMFYITFFIAVIGLIYSEISKAFK
jgi:hypothetical protein